MLHFIQEKLVALETRKVLRIGKPAQVVEDGKLKRPKIDEDLAPVTEDLTGPGRGPLHIVLVEVHRHATAVNGKVHEDTGDVLHIHLQRAQMASHGEDAAGESE